ncbi:hypothetical protein JCM8202_000081 [Rhodotorula sphaerocarpa]
MVAPAPPVQAASAMHASADSHPARTGLPREQQGRVDAGTPPAASTSTAPQTAAPQRKSLAQRNVELLSLPLQDSPDYYDLASSYGSDSELSDYGEGGVDDSYSLARPSPLNTVPATNRGSKLSKLAAHTRRGKLGQYPHAEGGDNPRSETGGVVGGDLGAGARAPAQKRRKLNDVAPIASEAGFSVAPNLHLVPRPVHALSRESDRPAPAYLPPVPQSPLDLLLMPSVQHTLGKKNETFHLLGASATALIEQEAELINALGKVCRGLRGEGFEWRWQGDAGRRQAKKEAKEEEEAQQKEGDEAATGTPADAAAVAAVGAEAAANEGATTPAEGSAPDAPPNDAPGSAQPGEVAVSASSSTAKDPAAECPNGDVKLEQATPILQSATAPAAAAASSEQVAVPGMAASGSEAQTAEQDVEMQPADAEKGESAQSSDATPNASARASEAPAIAVTADANAGQSATSGAADGPGAGSQPAPAVAAPTDGAAPVEMVEANGADADDAATTEATPAPSTAGGDESTTATRRRSGRVPATGRAGMRHTRSRQSSPEDEDAYSSGADEDAGLYDQDAAEDARGAGGKRGAAGVSGIGARAQLIPEEELPEYAERMVDPEGYVRSLFVTEGEKVELERVVSAPGGGVVGTGQFDSLTPNEQEVLLHDCMTDLHRFLADAIEYRNRLSEIRDGILGVERRRKGMWKVVRTVANDFLAEEEGAVYGQQQQQQQQQQDGAGYE